MKRLDEDDIVHLGTGKIIKDNGVLRELRAVKKFGDNMAQEDGDLEEDEDDEEEEDDDEDDQLDTLGDQDDLSDSDGAEEELEIQVQAPATNVPPVSQDDARDAEDLQTFLELGKDIGTEPEDEEEDEEEYEEDALYDATDGASSEVQSEVNGADTAEEYEDSEVPVNFSGSSDYAGPDESQSESDEDELNWNWAEDEASVVVPVVKDEEKEEEKPVDFVVLENDVIEILDSPPPSSRKTPSLQRSQSTKSLPHLQLYTPPHSRSSEQSPPNDTFATPPLSDLPAVRITPEIPVASTSSLAPPASTTSKLTPSSLKPKAKSKASKIPRPSSHSLLLPEQAKDKAVTPSPQKLKLVPEVIIERRTPLAKSTPSLAKPFTKSTEGKADLHIQSSSSSSKPRNKAKKAAEVDQSALSDNDMTPPSSPLKSKSSSSNSQSSKGPSAMKPIFTPTPPPPSETRDDPAAVEVRDSPPPSPRKRKRSLVAKSPEIESIAFSNRENAGTSCSKARARSPTQLEQSPEPSKTGTSLFSVFEYIELTKRIAKDARRSVHQRSPRKPRRSQSRPRYDSHSDSDDEPESDRYHRHPSIRSGSYHPPAHGMYPYPPLPMYAHPPHAQQQGQSASTANSGAFGSGMMLPDHQTQFIVSQVMQQLTAMATGQWGPMVPPQHNGNLYGSHQPEHPGSHRGSGRGPFTPTHSRHYRAQSMGPAYDGYLSGQGSSVYGTPQHQYGMYPYGFNPDMSRGTAPPDTPEHALRSSSPVREEREGEGKHGGQRRKALVERSRSRGRRVSFKATRRTESEGESGDDEMDGLGESPMGKKKSNEKTAKVEGKGKSKGKERADADTSRIRRKGKDRSRDLEEDIDEDDSDAQPLSRRGRMYERGQTPGPAVAPSLTKARTGSSTAPRARASSQHR